MHTRLELRNSLGRCGAGLPTRPRTRSCRAAWHGNSRVAAGKGGCFDAGTSGSSNKTMHGVVMEFSREWTNLLCMNFKLITKHTNASFNKANLRDLIAATGLVISNWIQIVNFSARMTVKFDGWPCKTIGHLFYATSSFVHLFVPIGEFKLQLQSGNA